MHTLIAQAVATEETVPGIAGIGRVCRIFSRRIYRALGAEDIRHRRVASREVLMRRLLSLGIERGLLPLRIYRGTAGNTRRFFPLKLPVALDADRALFVYADPGYETEPERARARTILENWAEASGVTPIWWTDEVA